MRSLLFKRLATSTIARRQITTTGAKRSSDPLIGHVDQEARAGSNIPFKINNRYKLAALMIAFFGSGFSAPFLIVRHQLLSKSA